ncbi:MAG: hypothetical protein JW934_04545 [Anaerolineae bacterium]|nr:hypothetical protein [Anaerolineae bacterium]
MRLGCKRSSLYSRELEALRLLAQGLDNEAIAARLTLTACTVQNHIIRTGKEQSQQNLPYDGYPDGIHATLAPSLRKIYTINQAK